MTPNIKIITAIDGRVPITKAFCVASKRIKDTFGIDTHAVVTNTDKENVEMCKQYGVHYIKHINKPLGRKWNAVVDSLREVDFTHLIVLGSDDIVANSFIEQLPLEHDVSGNHDLWFWGMNPNRAGYFTFGYWRGTKGRVGGVGRTISRRIIEDMDYKLWADDKNYGMDGNMIVNIKSKCKGIDWYSYSLKETNTFAMDVKYGHNISSLSPTLRNTELCEPEDVLYKHLPEDEINYLMQIRDNTVRR